MSLFVIVIGPKYLKLKDNNLTVANTSYYDEGTKVFINEMEKFIVLITIMHISGNPIFDVLKY